MRSQSLHIVQRRMELERIERENIKIAQKIYELKPYLQVIELEEQFHQQKRYGQSIRKIVRKKVLGPKILPPIEETRTNISKSVIVLGDNKVEGGGAAADAQNQLSQSLIQVKAVTKSGEGQIKEEVVSPVKSNDAPVAVDESKKNAQESPKKVESNPAP